MSFLDFLNEQQKERVTLSLLKTGNESLLPEKNLKSQISNLKKNLQYEEGSLSLEIFKSTEAEFNKEKNQRNMFLICKNAIIDQNTRLANYLLDKYQVLGSYQDEKSGNNLLHEYFLSNSEMKVPDFKLIASKINFTQRNNLGKLPEELIIAKTQHVEERESLKYFREIWSLQKEFCSFL